CPTKEPGGANDPSVVALLLALELRPPVDAERVRRVRLDVRLRLRTVEDVVARVVDDRSAERSHVPRPEDVRRLGSFGVGLGIVHLCPGRRMEHELRSLVERVRIGHVPLGTRDCPRLGEALRNAGAELAAGSRYEDAAASRSDRIGDWVLQRCFTRGSSQGISCSSGSAGSYSSVTW